VSSLTLIQFPLTHLDSLESVGFPRSIRSETTTTTLLIIDDCVEDRAVYRRYLTDDLQQAYRILEADSAEMGLQLLEKEGCDVILLDLQLPEMSGLEFLDRRKIQQIRTPVIMLTAYGDEAIAVQAMKAGAQDYLIKHYLKQDVLQLAVRHVLRQASLQQQLAKTQERQRLIASIALRIRQSLDLEEILNTAVTEVRELLKCDRVVVYQLIPDAKATIVAKSGLVEFLPPFYPLNLDVGSGSEDSTCYELQLRRSLQESEKGTDLVVPITLSLKNDCAKVWGVLVAYQRAAKHQWQTDETDILKELAIHLAIAIQQAELLAQTRSSLEKERELTAFKSQIITTVSHEYQSPLAAILAAASTLKTHAKTLSLAMQQRCLTIIEQKTRHLSALVEDMLIMNKADQVGTPFQPIPLNLGQFLASLVEEQRLAATIHHQISLDVVGKVEEFWGDRGILRHIFVNLLSNAVKYSPQGGKITVRLLEKETHFLCHIQDQGIGIPWEDQGRLFRSFSRGSNVGTIPGTGLGLAIARSCVSLHGGEISLESQVDRGTKVSVRLPKSSV
jgi:signal transduction histidine kinase/CheY-like chemotaxis protein